MSFSHSLSVRSDTVYRAAIFVLFLLLAACGTSKTETTRSANSPTNLPYGQLPCSSQSAGMPPSQSPYACGAFTPTFVVPTLTYQTGWYDRHGMYCGTRPDSRFGTTLYYWDSRSWAVVSYRRWARPTPVPRPHYQPYQPYQPVVYGNGHAGGHAVSHDRHDDDGGNWGVQSGGKVYVWVGGKFQVHL